MRWEVINDQLVFDRYYPIDLYRITKENYIAHVLHLKTKDWWTRNVADEFLQVYCDILKSKGVFLYEQNLNALEVV